VCVCVLACVCVGHTEFKQLRVVSLPSTLPRTMCVCVYLGALVCVCVCMRVYVCVYVFV